MLGLDLINLKGSMLVKRSLFKRVFAVSLLALNIGGSMSCYAGGDEVLNGTQKPSNGIQTSSKKSKSMYLKVGKWLDHVVLIEKPQIPAELLSFSARLHAIYLKIDNLMRYIFPFLYRKIIVTTGGNWKSQLLKNGVPEESVKEIETEIALEASRNGGTIKEVRGGFNTISANYVRSFKLYLNEHFLRDLDYVFKDISKIGEVCNNGDVCEIRDNLQLAKNIAHKLFEKTKIHELDYAEDVAEVDNFLKGTSRAFSVLRSVLGLDT